MADAAAKNPTPENFKGWLYKWTNYIKGYQRRWFVLSNGLLSYYRNQAEMAHTCRGTINLAGAYIDTEDSCNFVISSGAQTFHLKASSEVERQRWVTALELAKAKAIQMLEADSDAEDDIPTELDRNEFQGTLRILTSKLDDLNTCNDLIAKHGAALQRVLTDLESIKDPTELSTKLKGINERTTLFRITSNAMINACADYLELAQTQGRKWQKSLQYERDQRLRLEETIETLAKQHNTLEKACKQVKGGKNTKGTETAAQEHSEDEDNEFFDAIDDDPAFTETLLLPAIKTHRRNDSGASAASSEGTDRDVDYGSSDDEMMPEQREAVVLVNKTDASTQDVAKPLQRPRKKAGRVRRKTIPQRPNHSLNLWSIIKNCIGKELSKIPMPVNFNEPLSMLQRFAEESGFSDLLESAAMCEDTCEEMAYVAAFSMTAYTATAVRTTKPFNPLLGETFELDRSDDLGWRSFVEQVSHHPPAAAIHVESKDWTLWSDITITSKFRGKYLQVFPQGITHIQFKKSGSHYTYRKVTSTVHNIIVGKLWVDTSGECEIYNHTTGEKCRMNFKPYSYFSGDTPRKVTGVILDKASQARFILSGTWDKKMECARVQHISNEKSGKGKPVYQTGTPKLLWHQKPLPAGAELMYNLSELAITLNEPDEAVAPTDSRNRPDQRLMEDGHWDEANAEKLRLEEKQRAKRRKREAEAATAADSGKHVEPYHPLWFERKMDPLTKTMVYMFNNKYWKCKDRQDWTMCPDIF